jgi:DNA-directed RNA polymerase subunit RPC12/RpoP
MKEGYGVCPVCNGTCRQPVDESMKKYADTIYSYDKSDDTIACNNCGGQGMFGSPSGEVPLRSDGTPCKHEYKGVERGRCYTVYTCIHCKHSYDIDSGD